MFSNRGAVICRAVIFLHPFNPGLAFFSPFSCGDPCAGRTDPIKAKYLGANQYLDAGEVIGQIHQAHAHVGARRADAAQEDTAHAVFHVPKDVFDASAHP